MKKNLKRFIALALSATLALAPVVTYAGEEISEEVVWEEEQSEEQSYGDEAITEETVFNLSISLSGSSIPNIYILCLLSAFLL